MPDLLATDGVLTDGSSTSLVQRAEEAGTKVLVMTGNPDRIVELDGAGNLICRSRLRRKRSCNGSGKCLGKTEGED